MTDGPEPSYGPGNTSTFQELPRLAEDVFSTGPSSQVSQECEDVHFRVQIFFPVSFQIFCCIFISLRFHEKTKQKQNGEIYILLSKGMSDL